MLANPVLNQPINREAADMLLNSPETYKQVVCECVEYSKKIDGKQSVIVNLSLLSLTCVAYMCLFNVSLTCVSYMCLLYVSL